MKPIIHIHERAVGTDYPPYIVAEMSGNHNQSLDRALEIVDAAAEAGADAIKLQTYTADTITLNCKSAPFLINNPTSPWHGRNLYELYQEAHTPWHWHEALFARAQSRGIACFSSPFDFSAVDFLESLDNPVYKIASFELVDLPLIRKAAATGKPLVMSTGMASREEITEAVQAARDAGCSELCLLRCSSAYPAPAAGIHLRTLPALAETFDCAVGLSDHTQGIGVAMAAISLGACLIEKHFCLSRAEGGVDSAFSLEPAELSSLVVESHRAWEALGKVHMELDDGPEKNSIQFRRSLWITENLKKGDRLQSNNCRSLRPADGLAPKWLDKVLGKKLLVDTACGTPLRWDLLEE